MEILFTVEPLDKSNIYASSITNTTLFISITLGWRLKLKTLNIITLPKVLDDTKR